VSEEPQRHEPTPGQRRNAVVSALVLALVALGIYATVIAKFMVYG
jgi:hypothetical protein